MQTTPELLPNGIYEGLRAKAMDAIPNYSEFLTNSGHGGFAVMLPPPRHPDATFREYYHYDTHGNVIGLITACNPHEVWSDNGRIEVFNWEASSFTNGDEFVFPTRGAAELWLSMINDIFTSQQRRKGE